MTPESTLDRDFYTVAELARRWFLSEMTITRMIAAGQIESVKIGRARRIPREAVASYAARLRDGVA